VCNSDWGGEDCSQPLQCDACNTKHGKCTNGNCLCDSGYEGKKCDKRITCLKGPGGFECGGDTRGICDYGECTCKAGYEGDSCQDPTPCKNGCAENGMCIRGVCSCFKGWSGEDCSAFLGGKPCSTNPKEKKTTCSGHGVCFDGQCICHPAFKGKDCKVTKQCPRNGRDGPKGMRNKQCSNRGTCFMGECICRPGFSGNDCSEELPCDCSGHGVCHSGHCVCNPGFKGTNCATEEFCPGKTTQAPQGCSSHGVCNDGACFCFEGFGGVDCAYDLKEGKEAERQKSCVNPDQKPKHVGLAKNALSCSGHGVCGYQMRSKPVTEKDGVEFGRCLCMPGYGGDYCEEEKKCPSSCSGHGLCVAGICSCRHGYENADCGKVNMGVELCPNNCGAHGTCMLDECFCEPGFIGAACNVTIPCPSTGTNENDRQVCGGHGTCSRGKCSCSPGYDGESCDRRATCPNDCSKHGVCYQGGCLCEPGYAGKSCETSPGCGDKVCENGGLCRSGGCLCPNGYTGTICERLVPMAPVSASTVKVCPLDEAGLECGGHGKCQDETKKCQCVGGWSGESCEEPDMESLPSIGVEGEEVKEEEEGAVELMKEMTAEEKQTAEEKKATLLEVEEDPDRKREQPCVKHVDNNCDEFACSAVGGTCYDGAGLGCVCPASVLNDVCSKVLTLSVESKSTKMETLLSSGLQANLHQRSAESVKGQHGSSGWNVLPAIGFMITCCVLVVGVVVAAVIHSKRQTSSPSSAELDQRSLMVNDAEQRNHGSRGSLPVENAQLPLVSGFVSRR